MKDFKNSGQKSIKLPALLALLFSVIFVLTSCTGHTENTNNTGGQPDEPITICLDAGHGVGDVGAISPFKAEDGSEIYEKDINYAIVLLIADDLRSRGFDVILARAADGEEPTAGFDDDGKCGIVQRVKFANRKGYGMYLSIHCNSFTDSSVSGTRLYYNKGNNGSSNKRLAEKLSGAIESGFGKAPIIKNEADLYAVTATKMPACLIEVGFMTNEADLKNMLDPTWQKKFASAVCDGVQSYLK